MGNLRWMIFLGTICIITLFFSLTFDLQLRSGTLVATSAAAVHPRLLQDLGHVQFWLIYTDKNNIVHQVQIAAALDSAISDLRGRIFEERIFRMPTGTYQTDIYFTTTLPNGTEIVLSPTQLVGQTVRPYTNVTVHVEGPVVVQKELPPPPPSIPVPAAAAGGADPALPPVQAPSPPPASLSPDAPVPAVPAAAAPVADAPAAPQPAVTPPSPGQTPAGVVPVAAEVPPGPPAGVNVPRTVDPDGDPLADQTPDPAEVSLDQVNQGQQCSWEKLQGKFKGKRVFMVGNAPTINLLPIHMLAKEYTMVFNRWYLMEERLVWHPSFFLVIDSRVAKDTAHEIEAYLPKLTENAFIPDIYKYFRPNDKICKFKLLRMGFHTPPKVGGGGTVAHAGLQILHYLGFSPIYIIGVDLAYVLPNTTELDKKDPTDWTSKANIDPNHFDPRYFGTNYQYHYPQVEETMKPALRNASQYIKEHGGQIYDAGLGNVLPTLGIEQVDMNSLFNDTPPHERLRTMVRAAIEKCDLKVRVKKINPRMTLVRSLVNADPCVASTSEQFMACVQKRPPVIVSDIYNRTIEDLNEAVYFYKVFGPHDRQLMLCLRRDPISKQ